MFIADFCSLSLPSKHALARDVGELLKYADNGSRYANVPRVFFLMFPLAASVLRTRRGLRSESDQKMCRSLP